MNIDINTLKAGDSIQYTKASENNPCKTYWRRLTQKLLEQLKANPTEFIVSHVQKVSTIVQQGTKSYNDSWTNWQLVRADNEDEIRNGWDIETSLIREDSFSRGPGYEYLHSPYIRKGIGNKYLVTQDGGLDI